MKDNSFNDNQQAINNIEQRLRNSCVNFYNLSPHQKLCLLLSKNLNPYGKYISTDIGEEIIFYMEKLLNDGANLNYADEYGKTPLDIALDYRNLTSVLWLIENGAAGHLNLSQKLCMLLSTKHSVFDKSFLFAMEKLLQEGADINYVDHYGKTPLKIAIDSNNAQTVVWLADNGAQVNAEDKKYLDIQLQNHLGWCKFNPVTLNNLFFEKLITHGATNIKSSVILDMIKLLPNCESFNELTHFSKSVGTLVHQEIEKNLQNCTIHKFVLFNYLKSFPEFFTEQEIVKIDTASGHGFFKLLAVCQTPSLLICGNNVDLRELASINIAQYIDYADWLQAVGQVESSWWS
jgi:hypothetical protein